MENETELIRQQMLDTRTALSEKLEALQERVLTTVEGTTKTVTETVQTVQEAVQDTVSTVSESVQGTVETVKETLDVNRQVQRHPWLMFGGAVALGYFGGRLLNGGVRSMAPAHHANGFVSANGHTAPPPNEPGLLEKVAGPLLKQVQGMALGALTGVASDLVMQHAPEHLREHLHEMTNQLASALDTTPIHGLLSEEAKNERPS